MKLIQSSISFSQLSLLRFFVIKKTDPMQNRNLLKKIAVVAVIALLAGLPFAMKAIKQSTNVSNENVILSETGFEHDEFMKIHQSRIENFLTELQAESIEQSFDMLSDSQQFSYPGFHPNQLAISLDTETMLSARRFWKVFQEFQYLPKKQTEVLLNKFTDRAIKEYSDSFYACHAQYEIPNALPNNKDVQTAKYKVCLCMLLAVYSGNHSLFFDLLDTSRKIVEVNRVQMEYHRNRYPAGFSPEAILRFATVNDDFVASMLFYAFNVCAYQSEKIDGIKKLFDKKTVKICRWNSSLTWYDLLARTGRGTVNEKDVVMLFDVYYFLDYDVSKRQNTLNQMKNELLSIKERTKQ